MNTNTLALSTDPSYPTGTYEYDGNGFFMLVGPNQEDPRTSVVEVTVYDDEDDDSIFLVSFPSFQEALCMAYLLVQLPTLTKVVARNLLGEPLA